MGIEKKTKLTVEERKILSKFVSGSGPYNKQSSCSSFCSGGACTTGCQSSESYFKKERIY